MTRTKINCAEADALERVSVLAGLTDHAGFYGAPKVYTKWSLRDGRVLEDYRYPHRGQISPPDARPCEHYLSDATEEENT